MEKKIVILFSLVVMLFVALPSAHADGFDDAMNQMRSGKLEVAAAGFATFAGASAKDKRAPQALAMAARILDKLQDDLSERQEKKCYWVKGAPRTPACMESGVQEYNRRFGDGAFQYIGGTGVEFIAYTGSHYRRLLDQYAKSDYTAEAEFYLLLRQLQGHPDTVLPRVQAFLKSHPKGEWHLRGLLLWGRLNEDVSYVWRKWSWVVYNGKISAEELVIKSEPYRREAIKVFHEVIREGKGTFEAEAAQRDLGRLESTGDDGNLYGITNDASPGTWNMWGIQVP